MEKIIHSDSKALSVIRAEIGEDKSVAFLSEIISDVASYFSLGRTMNSYQIGETARLLQKEFYYLKIDDLKLFFERLKTGFYGQMYDRIDGNVIMVHLRTYCEERAKKAQELSAVKVEEKDEDNYMVCIGSNFLKDGEVWEEVDNVLLASCFSHSVAISIKENLIKNHFQNEPEKISIRQKNLVSSLWPYMEKTRPELIPEKTRFERATSEYYLKRDEIMKSDLTPLEKENAVRRLAGISEVTSDEFFEMNKAYK